MPLGLFDGWADWFKEGDFLSFRDDQEVRYYYMVIKRDLAHREYSWSSSIDSGEESGPLTPDFLEPTKFSVTRGYEQLWQLIFGLKPDVYIYVMLPTDLVRHGLPKEVQPSPSLRTVAHYTQLMSPYEYPSFLTEHFMTARLQPHIAFKAYNPQNITLTPKLNFFINKLELELIGTELRGELTVSTQRFTETLNKLHNRAIPQRPITMKPVRAPATTT